MIDTILNFFSVNTIFFTIFDYPMSYIEFFGTILNILAVYLVAKNNIWTWPVGNVAVILFGILFFQIQLYSDFFEQIYFFITGFYGWWLWHKHSQSKNIETKSLSDITQNSAQSNLLYGISIVLGTLVLGYMTSNFHNWLPQIFVEPASYPYLDAVTTVMSFAATILMIFKKVENWYLWILVDIIGIWLYYTKGVVFVSLLYVVFLILATQGYFNWKKLLTK
jgi:nicotinamide mononucleotide transporter